MDVAGLQLWLNAHGQDLTVDGQSGPRTRAAIINAFTNRQAPAASEDDIAAFAAELGCSLKQLRAVAKVESAGGGFTTAGMPKILFERHYFWRLTQGRFLVSPWNDAKGGGYGDDSWVKLTMAAGQDPEAAFSSASWGKFQIMGAHWSALGYPSPIAMAYAMTRSEAAHYDALVRFIRANHLEAKLKALSTRPADCESFAAAYNGPGFRKFKYHIKLAGAMA